MMHGILIDYRLLFRTMTPTVLSSRTFDKESHCSTIIVCPSTILSFIDNRMATGTETHCHRHTDIQ